MKEADVDELSWQIFLHVCCWDHLLLHLFAHLCLKHLLDLFHCNHFQLWTSRAVRCLFDLQVHLKRPHLFLQTLAGPL